MSTNPLLPPLPPPPPPDEGWGKIVRNAVRWICLMIAGAGTGLLICVADPNSHHATWDLIRAAAIAEIPVAAALKTQLEKSLGIGS